MNPNSAPNPVDYAAPVSSAFERVGQVLFRPFDLQRWLVIGFCAFLATLGEMGGGGGGGNFSKENQTFTARSMDDVKGVVETYIRDNYLWLVPTVVFAVALVVTLLLLVLWLSSRGRFMFLDNVATNRAEVVRPWHAHRLLGNSLFRFRLLLVGAGFVLFGLLLAVGLGATIPLFRGGEPTVLSVVVMVLIGLGGFLLGLAFFIVAKLTKDFVVPIMWLRGCDWRTGWAEFSEVLRARPGAFVLYLLFHLLLTIAVAIVILVVVLLTCCVAGCVLAIPYLGTVLLLPVLVFFRSFSAYFLAQFGPGYDVFLPRGADGRPTEPIQGAGA